MKKANFFILVWLLSLAPVPLFAAKPVIGADPNTYLAAVTGEMKLAWPHNRTINLVFHGHSVPAGYFETPVVRTFDAYPHQLHAALKEQYPNAVINIIVTAKGGEDSIAGAERFERDVLSHKPDVVMIDYGLNDRRVGLRDTEKAWLSMIEKAKAQNVGVILLTPTPDLNTDPNNPQDMLFKHALQIRRLALMNEVALADSYKQFTQYARQGGRREDLMSQSNHPNRKGHQLVAAELSRWFGVKMPAPQGD